MKRLGIVLGAVFVIVVSPFVVQYGWNEIITTIVPVGKITVWQALGMDALLSFIWPVLSSKKESEEDYSYLEDFEEVSKYMFENIAIIGNIYENPEFLEGSE